MKYQKIWNKTLSEDEEVRYEFSVGDRYRVLGTIAWSLIGLLLMSGENTGFGFFIILVALFYFGFYLKEANAYAFTNKRILIHQGWLSTKLNSIEYHKVTDIYIKEPFISRIITRTGIFVISTAGTGHKEVTLKHVDSPYEIKKRFDQITKSNDSRQNIQDSE